MRLSLKRIGWTWQSLATFIDHKGNRHNISEIGPNMFGSLLRSVWTTRMARTASTKRGLETRNQRRVEGEEEPVATGIPITQNEAGSTGEDLGQQVSTCTAAIPLDLHHVKLLLHSKQGGEPLLNPLQASCLQNFVVGGVWTQTRLHLAGYEVDTTCALCKVKEDTIEHRVFDCPWSQKARGQIKWKEGEGNLEEARAHPMASKGLAHDPTWNQPKPAEQGQRNFQYTDKDFA